MNRAPKRSAYKIGREKMDSGIPYFMLKCQLDDSYNLIEAEFGVKGLGVVVRLLQKIYGGAGYYSEWTKDVGLLFSKNIGEGYSFVSEIVSASIRRGIFSQQMYDRYGILTSKEIQEQYLNAVSRRKSVKLLKEYLLIKVDENLKNVDILSKNADNFEENADNSEQRREEKRKEENRREDISAQGAQPVQDISVNNVDNSDLIRAVDYYKKYIGDVNDQVLLGLTNALRDGVPVTEIFVKLEYISRKFTYPTWEIVKNQLVQMR